MTETNMNTSNPYDGERVPGAVGHPLPGVSVRVTDPETGKELAPETIGMIEVKGPNVFKGYWRMPEKTKAEFRDDGFFITGDLGKIDGKGYVHIVGRGKDLVISGGFNVYPKEIESEIDAMPGVIEIRRDRRPTRRFRRGRHCGPGLRQGRQGRRSLGAESARRQAGEIQDAEAGDRGRRNCRATPWARCRRIFCAIPIRRFTRSSRIPHGEERTGQRLRARVSNHGTCLLPSFETPRSARGSSG